MKIIISRTLWKASSDVGAEVAQAIAPGFPTFTVEEQLNQLLEGNAFKHFAIEVDSNEISYEISDELLIRILRMYSRVISTCAAIVQLAKPLFAGFKNDIAAINEMAREPKE